ncbi:MAG: 30S ribosomal protein S6 [Clostridia bacterium]|nr:30S ribosomal protein S6 [Clostridia bacterium]
MNKYELLYIIDASVSDEARNALIEKFVKFVKDNGGVVEKEPEKFGVKKYAYPINDKNEGYYCLMSFESNPEVPNKLTALMKITDGIVRTMIEKK